jgi:ABC-type uncharacterized transport system substrate-binding protein
VCRQALKGLDLPRRAADEFELVVNLKTAKALGLTIPQSVLLRADELIQWLAMPRQRARPAPGLP